MNDVKRQAIDTMNELHRTIPYNDYCTVMDGLQDIETLRDRDEELEELWRQFGDIPMDPETECIEEQFMGWGPRPSTGRKYGTGSTGGTARASPTCCTEELKTMYRRPSSSTG